MRRVLFFAALLSLLLLVPLFVDSYILGIFILIYFYAYIGQGWNILTGYTGNISLGHALFIGIGAYVSTCLAIHYGLTPWIGMWIGGLFAALIGLFMGYMGFRFGLKGIYFVLLTIAFSEIARLIALHMNLLGSFSGMFIDFRPSFYNFQFRGNVPYYYISLGFMIFSIIVVWLLERSKLGRYFVAIREDEDAAESLGVNTFKYKMIAIGISGFITSLGGTFYANYIFYLHPDKILDITLSIELILRPIVGGLGTPFGPVIGSFILTPLAEMSRSYFSKGGLEGLHLIIYGFLMIIVVIFLPKGVFAYLQRALRPLL